MRLSSLSLSILINDEIYNGRFCKGQGSYNKGPGGSCHPAQGSRTPGHIFPLKAKAKGVLRSAGHTEAVVDLTRFAGLRPGGALVEIMNDDGSMARLRDLKRDKRKVRYQDSYNKRPDHLYSRARLNY